MVAHHWLLVLALALLAASGSAAEPRRDVFVDCKAEPGGDGSRELPYATVQEMVDQHDADWGQVFLQPGTYREDVNIHRGRFWFFPAQQYGVHIEGSMTVRMPGTKIRGMILRSEGSAIVLADGASGCEVQHCRIEAVGEGGAGIEIAGSDVSGCLINGNVVELVEGGGRAGIRVAVQTGVTSNHIDHNKIAGCEEGIALLADGGTEDQVNVVTSNRLYGCGISVEPEAGEVTVAWNEIDGELDADLYAEATAQPHEPRTVRVASDDELSAAVAELGPGDEVILADGEYAETLEIRAVGTPKARITIRAANPLGAVVRGAAWTLRHAAYVRIEGLSFVDVPGSAVILGAYAQHCEVADCRISREAEGGGGAISVSGPSASHNVFWGNTIRLNHGGVGIQITCQRWNWHLTMSANDISGCYYGIQTGAGSYPTAPPGYHRIEGNELHHNWKEGFHSKTTDNIIRGNHVHNNDSCGMTTRYGSRNVFEGNWIHSNSRGMRLHSKSHFVVNNVIFNNGGDGIYLGSWPGDKEGEYPYSFEPYYEPPHEVWIANNTIAHNSGAPIFADNGTQVMALRNILVGTGEDAPGVKFAVGGVARQVEQNLYWQCRPPLLREYEGGEYDVLADPLFVDPENGDYRADRDGPAWDVSAIGDAFWEMLRLSVPMAEAPPKEHIGAHLGPPPASLAGKESDE